MRLLASPVNSDNEAGEQLKKLTLPCSNERGGVFFYHRGALRSASEPYRDI